MKNTIVGAVLMVAAIIALIATGHLNILLAIFMIGLVICFHEFGHFLLARINGVTVKEFSIGLGPRLITWKMRGTRWSVKLLPFGGSCLMLGDDEPLTTDEIDKEKEEAEKEEAKDEAKEAEASADDEAKEKTELPQDEEGCSFASKNVWQRISIIFAGPFFNFILAFLLACIIIGSIGYDPAIVTSVTEEVAEKTGLSVGDTITEYQEHTIRIGRDVALYETLDGVPKMVTITYEHNGESFTKTYDSVFVKRYMCGIGYNYYQDGTVAAMKLTDAVGAAAEAGLQVGDEVIRFNGCEIATAADFQKYVSEHPIGADPVEFVVRRDGQELTFKVTPILTEEYQLGFGYNIDYREKVGPIGVIKYGVNEVGYWIKATIKSLGYIFQGKASRKDVGGAVRVVSEMSNVVEESYETDGTFYAFLNLINWAILLSANLGVMNLLPIPALDGGRLLFLFIEAIRGKKANRKVEAVVTLIGFILLMILMVFILFNDIANVFG